MQNFNFNKNFCLSIKRKEKAFVLPTAIVILGLILALSTILISLSVNEDRSLKIDINNFETRLMSYQIENDFTTLNKDKFLKHLELYDCEKIDKSNENYYLNNKKFILNLSADFKELTIKENKSNLKVLELKVDEERNVILKNL